MLREALTRGQVARQKSVGIRVRKGKVAESVKAFIQNVHNFRDDALIDTGPPAEHVVIFDEANARGICDKPRALCSAKRIGPGSPVQSQSS